MYRGKFLYLYMYLFNSGIFIWKLETLTVFYERIEPQRRVEEKEIHTDNTKMEQTERPSCMFAKDWKKNFIRHETCKRKRKRVHIPHSKRPKEFVAKRNSKERQRVGEMANAFDALMSILPCSSGSSKPSRSEILRETIDYIRELEYELIDSDNNQSCARSCNIRDAMRDCPNIWQDSSGETTTGFFSGNIMEKEALQHRTACRLCPGDCVGLSHTVAEGFVCKSDQHVYHPQVPLERTCEFSFQMPSIPDQIPHVSKPTLDFSMTLNDRKLSEIKETVIYTHKTLNERYCESSKFDAMSNGDPNTSLTHLQCHVNGALRTRNNSERKLVDITNWCTESQNNSYFSGITKTRSLGENHPADNNSYLPVTDVYGGQTGSMDSELMGFVGESEARFYKIL